MVSIATDGLLINQLREAAGRYPSVMELVSIRQNQTVDNDFPYKACLRPLCGLFPSLQDLRLGDSYTLSDLEDAIAGCHQLCRLQLELVPLHNDEWQSSVHKAIRNASPTLKYLIITTRDHSSPLQYAWSPTFLDMELPSLRVLVIDLFHFERVEEEEVLEIARQCPSLEWVIVILQGACRIIEVHRYLYSPRVVEDRQAHRANLRVQQHSTVFHGGFSLTELYPQLFSVICTGSMSLDPLFFSLYRRCDWCRPHL